MPLSPDQQSGMPLNYGVVDDVAATPVFAQPWFYLFQTLWRKLGGQFSAPQKMVYAEQTGTKEVTFYSVQNGAVVGKVTLT